MGHQNFSIVCLEAIRNSHHEVVGVITAPDKPAGRGRKLRQPAIKKIALDWRLPLFQPPNLKDPSFINQLQLLKADLFVVVAFRMLPKIVWSMPPKGTINLHASLLPNYRGAAPINWVIINQETKTGVSTFYIDDKIDSGEILMQEKISIEKKETAGSLLHTLSSIGSEILIKTINDIGKNIIKSYPQTWNESYCLAPKLTSENCKIDWNNPSEKIEALIRGLNPYPLAWTVLNKGTGKLKTKIHSAIIHNSMLRRKPGEILVKDKKLYVATKNGYLRLTELQIENRKKLTDQSLLNGFTLDESSKFE